MKREPVNDAYRAYDRFPTTGLYLDVNAPKRYRPYFVEVPGPHIEIHDGKGVVVEATADEIKRLSTVHVVEPSRHGITHTAPEDAPDDWIEVVFAAQIAEDLGIDQPLPPWANQPAITLVPVNRPTILERLNLPNLRPFSTVAYWDDSITGRAYAAWHQDATADTVEWHDLADNSPITFAEETTNKLGFDGQTIDYALRRIRSSTDPTTIGHRGLIVARRTRGIIRPGPTISTGIRLIGRESRGWRDDRVMLNEDTQLIYDTPPDPEEMRQLRDRFSHRGGAVALAAVTGVAESTVRGFLNGAAPKPETWIRLRAALDGLGWSLAARPVPGQKSRVSLRSPLLRNT